MIRPFVLLLAMAAPALADEAPSRIVSIGGSVTEILYALGAGDRVVARDTTSSFPPEVMDLPDIGYMRALSPEGVLSRDADMILAEEGAGPPEAVAVLKAAGIRYVEITEGYDAAGIGDKIEAIGAAAGLATEAATLRDTVGQDLDLAGTLADGVEAPQKVLFVLSLAGGAVMAAGEDTAADGIIHLAGAENALSGFQGYKRITDEAIMTAAPDVILMMDRGPGAPAELDGDPAQVPALAATPAVRDGRVLRMDGNYLLGFGPRVGKAAIELHRAIYGNG